jgi:transposase
VYLSEHDLKQLDESYVGSLPMESLQPLSLKLLSDLKEALDRLNQNPSNSSRPPSTRAPWERAEADAQNEDERDDEEVAPTVASDPLEGEPTEKDAQTPPRDDGESKEKQRRGRDGKQLRPGRPEGAPGYSRTQQLPVDAEQVHRPETCAGCAAGLGEELEYRAYTARYEIELLQPGEGGNGLVLFQTKHIHQQCQCSCGHWTRAEPGRRGEEAGWSVELTEWHLAGPLLVAFICALALRMRLSRARIREFLHDWLGLKLGVATINQCIHEGGRAVEPVVEQEILSAIREAELLHADETSWKEQGQLLWLWVFTCATATFFIVGKRSRELLWRVLGQSYEHWLMSDGYWAYRDYLQRLRCLAHVTRKARGLKQSLDRQARGFGEPRFLSSKWRYNSNSLNH